MGWFSNEYERDRRREDRAAGEAKARRLTELYQELQRAVAEAVATDAVVEGLVFQLAMLDVKVDTMVTVELGYEPWRGPEAQADLETLAAAGLGLGDAVPLVDDADRIRLNGMGVRTEQ